MCLYNQNPYHNNNMYIYIIIVMVFIYWWTSFCGIPVGDNKGCAKWWNVYIFGGFFYK